MNFLSVKLSQIVQSCSICNNMQHKQLAHIRSAITFNEYYQTSHKIR